MKLRGLVFNLIIFGTSLLVMLVLLEVVTRRLLPLWPDPISDFDPRLGYSHVPGASGWWVSIINPLEFRTWVTINSHGLRDHEIDLEKPEGITRLLVIGDSVVDALEVPLEATFVKQLENNLRVSGYPVEVINGGHYGYGTDQELLFYQYKGHEFDPDLVVLAFYPGNDVLDNSSSYTLSAKPYFELAADGSLALRNVPVPPPEAKGGLSDPVSWIKGLLYDHSRLYRFAVYQTKRRFPVLQRNLRRTEVEPQTASPRESEPSIYSAKLSQEIEEAWILTQSIMLDLKREVERTGATLVIVVMPDRKQFLLPTDDESINVTVWNDRLAQFCDEHALDCLDLYPVFLEQTYRQDRSPLFYQYDIHPTADGHALIADAMHDFLVDEIFSKPQN